ncbi:MAG: DUF4625 domain-containing protein [Sphingobacteriales bacterium]|nr:DUF4625 domain-containing protein [Sphingobacteriales bacterium]
MNNLQKLCTFFIVFGLFFASCTEETEDVTAPTITVNTPLTDNALAVSTGTTQSLQYTVNDDVDVATVSIKITYASDSSLAPLEVYSYSKTHNVTATITEFQGNETLQIPANITAGVYTVTIGATDASGKTAATKIFDLLVTNTADTAMPNIVLTQPPTDNVTVGPGNTISVFGTITDNTGVHKVVVQFIRNDNSSIVDNYVLDAGDVNSYSLSKNIEAPILVGNYTILVAAIDKYGNITINDSKKFKVQ